MPNTVDQSTGMMSGAAVRPPLESTRRAELHGERAVQSAAEQEVTLLALLNFFLRWRRAILLACIVGATLGIVRPLLRPRLYASTATFLTEQSGAGPQLSTTAAGLLGINVAQGQGTGWGPAIYVELLQSPSVLRRIALDTIAVPELGGRRVAVVDLLGVPSNRPPEWRMDRAVKQLTKILDVTPETSIGGVTISVTTRWPTASMQLATLLLHEVERFNVQTRQSQASAERRFIEQQTENAELALRDIEDRATSFLQRNRSYAGSPELTFEFNRLQQELALKQQAYTSLVQSRDQARSREVRDTPVITVLDEPALPIQPEARGLLGKLFFGVVIATILVCLFAVAVDGVRRAYDSPSADAREFLRLLDQAIPRVGQWLRRS
jgi:uncharacterized protein involved in exopolysaccharide biosynthesis